MVADEEMFNKEVDKVVKKPKRKLTEKQLENLAKGRAKMAEKRAAAKLKKAETDEKKLVKSSDKCAKEGQKTDKINHKEKRRTLKEINAEKEKTILARLEKEETDKYNKKNSRMDLFTSLKVKCLEQAKCVSEYNEIKNALDGIDEDTLHNDDKLKSYAKTIMKPYIKVKKKLSDIKEDEIFIKDKPKAEE
tara:strand:- start:754 stop:1326 length:573 start_codon:yes stop_codon:yes gene_type:complete